jgi:hypothetical protein
MGNSQDGDLYQHDWTQTSDLAASAKAFAHWMDGVIAEAHAHSQRLAGAWQSDASGVYVDGTLKTAHNHAQNTKVAMDTYHGAVSTASDIASSTEKANVNTVQI